MSLKSWKEIPIGGVIDKPGTAREYKTGTWRVMRPVLHKEKCIDCMFCWLYCPDQAVIQEGGIMKGFDYDYCKGCGLCASVCPKQAIEMRPETEFLGEEG
ncbi:pyruvate synthase subunit PorD [Thermotoga sp.]|uniref:pyruvate synthase subunit PorD n=1 Tax=Thermotoga sp. TaxID=28240 RepID=UPI0025FFE477|nr:pyruvate synthase subunit PorD [Thermotoga sp.]MCD6550690.1 4Fe-4S binding protein [Thermotoga sp.]